MIFSEGVTALQRAARYAETSAGLWQLDRDHAAQAADADAVVAQETEQRIADAVASDDRDGTYRLSAWRAGPRIVMSDGAATVHVLGPLDPHWGFNADRASHYLDALAPTSIELAVASPGGYAEQGFRFYADMRARVAAGTPVTSRASGLVASAAILVFAAGETRRAPVGSRFMAHAAYVLALAAFNRARLQTIAESIGAVLDATDNGQREIWLAAGVSEGTADAWLDGADHWLSRGDAEAAGLVTEATGEDGNAAGTTEASEVAVDEASATAAGAPCAPEGGGAPEPTGGAGAAGDDAARTARDAMAESARMNADLIADFQRRAT